MITQIIHKRKSRWQNKPEEEYHIEEFDENGNCIKYIIKLGTDNVERIYECKHRWVGEYHIITQIFNGEVVNMEAYDKNNNLILSRLGKEPDYLWDVYKYDDDNRLTLIITSYGYFEEITYKIKEA